MIPSVDQCNNTGQCRDTWSNATDCKDSASAQSICMCGNERCDAQTPPPSSSSSAASSAPAPAGCDDAVAAGKFAYEGDCAGCHGDVPTDGRSSWSNGPFSLDTYDSDNNGYKPRGNGAPQMLTLGDFIALYMPSMGSGVGQPAGDNIAAYITHTVDGPEWCPGDDWPPQAQTPKNDFPIALKAQQKTIVAPGPYAGCVINDDKKAKCWGGNFMLPNTNACRKTPANWGKGDCISRAVAPNDLGNIVALSGSHVGVCSILEQPKNGSNIYCWGAKDRVGTHYPKWTNAVSVVSGDRHSCALRANGQVQCWGERYANDPFPTPPNNLKAKALAAAQDAVCAIKADDSVVCWGSNIAQPPADLKAKQITLGGINLNNVSKHHACAINMSDKVVCWGNGQGANQPNNISAISVAASADSSCAVLSNGQTRCWGPLTDIGNSTVQQNGNNGPQGSNYLSVNASRYSIIFTKTDGSLVRFRDYNIKGKLNQNPATEAADLPNGIKVLIAD